jgi:hypothetical protein
MGSSRSGYWPFQGVRNSEYSLQANPRASSVFRPVAWGITRPASSIFEADIVPDYIVNFMRGETPESLAMKRDLRRGIGAQTPQCRDRPRYHRSMTADIYLDGDSPDPWLGDDEKGMLDNDPRRPWTMKTLTTGWRGGIAINLALTVAALAAAAVCLGFSAKQVRVLGGQLEIRRGECSAVRSVGYGITAAVNVLGLIVLAGANYAFQVLSSPTRPEVDLAHHQQSWVDIGIPSLRNLVFINGIRAFLAAIIVILGIASQVIYNSLVFVTSDESGCAVVLNNTMLLVIIILNVMLVFSLSLAMGRPTLDPIVTIGDAISSFLTTPDRTTQGGCLLQAHEVDEFMLGGRQPKTWSQQSHRWIQAPSISRWLAGWLFFWVVCVGLAVMVLVKTLGDQSVKPFEMFGRANSVYLFSTGPPDTATALIVALPHITYGVLYLASNALLSMFFVSHEFSQYAIPGTLLPLRVSNGAPLGAQTGSLYLSLPRLYSWLLFFLFAGIGFLVSQSMFLMSVDDDGSTTAAIGISPLPLVMLLGLLAIVAFGTMALSLRTTNPSAALDARGTKAGNPLALKGGANSIIISSRCQRSPLEGEDMVTRLLGWGVVRMPNDARARHAAFSNNPQGVMHVGIGYA